MKCGNVRWDTQLAVQGQWWSIFGTHLGYISTKYLRPSSHGDRVSLYAGAYSPLASLAMMRPRWLEHFTSPAPTLPIINRIKQLILSRFPFGSLLVARRLPFPWYTSRIRQPGPDIADPCADNEQVEFDQFISVQRSRFDVEEQKLRGVRKEYYQNTY